jgi:nucleotide-binding universal stress UspA family protein
VVEFRRIVYSTDFSRLSAWALPHAVYLARTCGAELHCLHVVDDSYQYWLSFDVASVPAGPPPDELESASRKQLDELVESQIPDDVTVVREILRGQPFVEIIRYAREHRADLIVLGTHGWSALREVLMGSVADKVVRKSPCPVLTVRHPEQKFEMP